MDALKGKGGSADPRQLLAVQHVDDALDAEGAAARDLPGRPFSHRADHVSTARHRVSPQERDGALRIFGRDKSDEASLIGHVKRIEAEKLAGGDHLSALWDRLFL